MEYFKLLPQEIPLEILTRLPTESVLDSKLVCTNWRNIISHHPSFSKMHFHHHLNHPFSESAGKLGFLALTHRRLYYFEYDENHDMSATPIRRVRRIDFTSPFKFFCIWLVGSVNGLVCLLERSLFIIGSSVCICNPITKECLRLPEIKKRDGDVEYEHTSFGYVSSTNEYIIVWFYKLKTCLEVHIYTLGSGDGWRNLGEFNCGYNLYLKDKVFFANGALYWLDHALQMIGTLDLTEKNFCKHLSPPPVPLESNWFDYRIGVSDGVLYFALEKQGDGFNDVWLLKKKNHNHAKEEGDEHQSLGWKKDIRNPRMDFLAVSKSGGVFTYSGSYLNINDTKTSTSKSVVQLESYILGVLPHKNTLVSPKELGEESAKIEDTKSGEQLDADAEYIYL